MFKSRHLSADQITAYIDGELSAVAMGASRRHLATCPACRGQVEAQTRTVALLHTSDHKTGFMPADPAAGLPGILLALAERQAGAPISVWEGKQAARRLMWAWVFLGTFLLLYGMQSLVSNLAARAGGKNDTSLASYVERHKNLESFYETISAR